jgi:hypothetical protein
VFRLLVEPGGAVSETCTGRTGDLSAEVDARIRGELAALAFAPPRGGRAEICGAYKFVNKAGAPSAP